MKDDSIEILCSTCGRDIHTNDPSFFEYKGEYYCCQSCQDK